MKYLLDLINKSNNIIKNNKIIVLLFSIIIGFIMLTCLKTNLQQKEGFISEMKSTTFEFTNAGAIGEVGPTQIQVDNAYLNTNLQGQVISNKGIQEFIVPFTGTYQIEARGARAGSNIPDIHHDEKNHDDKMGTYVRGDFKLNEGDKLFIIVGQQGSGQGNGAWGTCIGNGGSSSVQKESQGSTDEEPTSEILLVAGGGEGSVISKENLGFFDICKNNQPQVKRLENNGLDNENKITRVKENDGHGNVKITKILSHEELDHLKENLKCRELGYQDCLDMAKEEKCKSYRDPYAKNYLSCRDYNTKEKACKNAGFKSCRDKKDREEEVDPSSCFMFSDKFEKENKIITDQGCNLDKGSNSTLSDCRAKCIDSGNICKGFVYRHIPYKDNTCWLKSCDGYDQDEQVNISKYELNTGIQADGFQTWHRLQEGQAWDWKRCDRQVANMDYKAMCPRKMQVLKEAELKEELEKERIIDSAYGSIDMSEKADENNQVLI